MYIPAVDSHLTVTLPGEIMRCCVVNVVNRNTVMVELGQPFSKVHQWRKGDIVGVRRKANSLGEIWEAEDDRVILRAEEPEIAPPAPIVEEIPEPEEAKNAVVPKRRARA